MFWHLVGCYTAFFDTPSSGGMLKCVHVLQASSAQERYCVQKVTKLK